MRKIARIIYTIIIIMTILGFALSAAAEEIELRSLLSGTLSNPLRIMLISPSYRKLAQYGDERLDGLNRLMSHFSVDILLDESLSETSLLLDNELLFSITEMTDGDVTKSIYSVEPETVYENDGNDRESDFSLFLEKQFFNMNRLMDDLYQVFEKTADVFQELGREEKANLNFSGFGKGVRRITIPVPADYVSEYFPAAVSNLAVSDESRDFIEKLVFSGPQKIILLYDQDNCLLRINYDGMIGLSEDTLRKVSLVWRCVRKDNHKKDKLELKTPRIQGSDRYNLTFIRDLDLTREDQHSLSWDLQIDDKNGDEKKKTQYKAELSFNDGIMQGEILFSNKKDGMEEKLIIAPEMRKENDSQYSGTLEITNKKGKITISSIQCGFCMSAAEGNSITFPVAQSFKDAGKASKEEVLRRMESILIRGLVKLPPSDTNFMSSDIPGDVWKSLIESVE